MKILLLTSVLPWPLRRNGGAQRTELIKQALLRHGTVDVLGVGGPELFEKGSSWESESSALKAAGVVACVQIKEAAFRPLPKFLSRLDRLARTLRANQSRYQVDKNAAETFQAILSEHGPYDLIVTRYLSTAIKVGLDQITNIPKILDFDDIDWLTFKSTSKANPWPGLGGRVGQALVLRIVKKACSRGIRHFDGVWVTSAEDAEHVVSAEVLPNLPFSHMDIARVDTRSNPRDSQHVLFVGDLQFPPNVHGLDRFISNIWPQIRKKIPTAQLQIVGRGLDENKATEWMNHAGILVTGFVDDLSACYQQAAFTVVPVYFGGGTKIKVLESLAFGRTVVATPDALRGYASLMTQPAAVACSVGDTDFVQDCIDLLKNSVRRESMAKIGLARVRREFSFVSFSSTVTTTVDMVFKKYESLLSK